MADRLRFHPLVASDLRDAIAWYDGISIQLGNRFRKMVNDRFDQIADHPKKFAVAYEDVRFARVKRFPYLVLFSERRDAIFVLGVFHGASDPMKWGHRSGETQ